jgi:hypothetical protein
VVSGVRDRRWRQAARGLSLDRSLAEVVDAFAEVGVRSLLIKGPAFARWLYDDPRERRYRDIDLLIAPEHFHAAQRCLLELGFEHPLARTRDHEKSEYQEEWIRRRRVPAVVELHYTLHFMQAPPAVVWRTASEGSHPIEVAGTRVDTPGVPVCALILGLHAAHHGVGVGKPIRDLESALARVDFKDWGVAAVLARELGAAPAFAMGLQLARGGDELTDRLGLSAESPSRFVRLHTRTPPATAMGIEELVSTQGAGARLRLLALKLVPSRAFMRGCYPLARRGHLGLICAYALRPLRLAIKLPRGVQAWLRAALSPKL